jgi:acyl dehydratase
MFSYLLGTELPGRGTNWLKQNIYLPNPAYLGEEITAEVKVVRIRPDKDLFYLQDQCITSKGKVVCQAESLVMAKEMLSR